MTDTLFGLEWVRQLTPSGAPLQTAASTLAGSSASGRIAGVTWISLPTMLEPKFSTYWPAPEKRIEIPPDCCRIVPSVSTNAHRIPILPRVTAPLAIAAVLTPPAATLFADAAESAVAA